MAETRAGALFSQKRLIQAGSLAAALGSILGLVFTVGDRVTSVFGGDGGEPQGRIDAVHVEPMTLRNYLATRTDVGAGDRLPYSEKKLAARVLAVDVRAHYANAPRGEHFPVVVTLERRDAHGVPDAVGSVQEEWYIERDDDQCVCHARFDLPPPGREYRVEVRLLDPSGRVTEPDDTRPSDWFRV